MEGWSNGVMGGICFALILPTLQHSHTPTLQYSTTPALHYSSLSPPQEPGEELRIGEAGVAALADDDQAERGDDEQAVVAGADGGDEVVRGVVANAALVPVLLLPLFL